MLKEEVGVSGRAPIEALLPEIDVEPRERDPELVSRLSKVRGLSFDLHGLEWREANVATRSRRNSAPLSALVVLQSEGEVFMESAGDPESNARLGYCFILIGLIPDCLHILTEKRVNCDGKNTVVILIQTPFSSDGFTCRAPARECVQVEK
jgi:hypothetical protein